MSNLFKPYKDITNKPTKLELTATGEYVINQRPFAMSIENVGKRSEKGFCLAIAGDAVDSGRFNVKELEVQLAWDSKSQIAKIPFERVMKNDGRYCFQAKVKNVVLLDGLKLKWYKFPNEGNLIAYFEERMKREIHLHFTAEYSGEDAEVLINAFPYEDVLMGASNVWKTATTKNLF